MRILLPKTDTEWNDNRLTLDERQEGLLDVVAICVHEEGDDAYDGSTVFVLRSELVRAAKMLEVSETP